MPILLTLGTITYLFTRGSKGEASFLGPAALRTKLEDLEDGETRAEALEIADELEEVARSYDQAAADALSEYTDDVRDWSSSADALIATLEPLDDLRGKTLQDVVGLRQRLADALSTEEWEEVFG